MTQNQASIVLVTEGYSTPLSATGTCIVDGSISHDFMGDVEIRLPCNALLLLKQKQVIGYVGRETEFAP